MTRQRKLLGNVEPRHARGLEIGALTTPVVRKDEGIILYVDHASREELQEKYRNDSNVNAEQLVTVDAIWGDKTLKECFLGQPAFDYAIASHVIEHVPDLIGWLDEIADVLRPGGQVILAIPDKRYCFDYLRQPSRLSELVDAWLRRNRRPMPAQLFDYNVNAVEVDMNAAWAGPLEPSSLQRYVTPRAALDYSIQSVREGKYIDAHCWVFTPESLLKLMSEMVDLDLLRYGCVRFHEPEINTNEMILVLERNTDGVMSDLQKTAARESFLVHLRQQNSETLPSSDINDALNALRDQNDLLAAKIASMQMTHLENPVLNGRLEAALAELNALRSSTSWKITAPMRWARQLTCSLQNRRFT